MSSSDDEDVMEESQKINRMFSDSLQAADQEQLEPSGRRKPQLVRYPPWVIKFNLI